MMNNLLVKPSMAVRIGLALLAMSAVLFELILTRIFSANAGYHFAFMIVSTSMFGMTAGALYVFARSPLNENILFQKLCLSACLFAVSMPVSCIVQNYIGDARQQMPFVWIALMFVLYSIPFFFSGVAISLCLTCFSQVGKLYAADLVGAAISCVLLIVGLTYLDQQMIVIIASILASFAAFCFSFNNISKSKNIITVPMAVFVICILVGLVLENINGRSLDMFDKVELVKWSPIGRVVVGDFLGPAVTWARVKMRESSPVVPQKGLWIDFGAFTVMTAGNANEVQMAPIKHDITALANRLRPERSVFIIGVGGGRDVLTGLLYKQKKIDGIEINPAIVSLIKHRYADFNGHLATRPGVNIINDEARNWLARSQNKYGIIQCSLVDTWSASSSGAFMLTENILYTKEAFDLFIRHIDSDGLLSFLRWGDIKEPGQILRMLYLAKTALLTSGIHNAGSHIMLVTVPYREKDVSCNIGAMLFSPTEFSKTDIDNLVTIARQEGYGLLWVPGVAELEPFASAIRKPGIDSNIPTDDCPFFFTPVKASANESSMAEPAQGKGLMLLMFTLNFSCFLTLFVILFPAWLANRNAIGPVRQVIKSGFFFICLGLAFMLVEVGQIQRLSILLGNPTYSLSVVLFALLLASGLGSYTAQLLVNKNSSPAKLLRIGLSIAALSIIISALWFNNWSLNLESARLTQRMMVAIFLVAVPGFFMGWGFPLGMTYFTRINNKAGAWYWAMNGAASVLGSILAAIISLVWGIKVTILSGGLCYLLSLLSLL